MGSSRCALARPVRRPDSSRLSASSDPRMRFSRSLMSNEPLAIVASFGAAGGAATAARVPVTHDRRGARPADRRLFDDGRPSLAAQHLQKIARLVDGEDNYRKSIVAGK